MKSIHQILTEANSKVSKADKLKVLMENNSKTLQYILQGAYDKRVKCLLPDGEPPFNPVEKSKQVTLQAVEKDIPSLYKNGPMTKEPSVKVEMFFMQMLSKLTPEDAKIMVMAKDQRLQSIFKRLTKPVVKEFLAANNIQIEI